MFELGLLRWVRESVLSSKAPLRERVNFVLDGDEDGKGKGKKEDACLNLAMTKRQDSVKYRDVRFSFSSFLSLFFSFFFFLSSLLHCTTWNALFLMLCFSPNLAPNGKGSSLSLFDFSFGNLY